MPLQITLFNLQYILTFKEISEGILNQAYILCTWFHIVYIVAMVKHIYLQSLENCNILCWTTVSHLAKADPSFCSLKSDYEFLLMGSLKSGNFLQLCNMLCYLTTSMKRSADLHPVSS